MQGAHRANVDAYSRWVEQARAEAMLGKEAREQQNQLLARLRRKVDELQGTKAEAARLANENRKLVLELDRQRKYSDDQLTAAKVQLEQAGTKIKAQRSEIGLWRRGVEAVRAEAVDLRELLSPTPEGSGRRPHLAASGRPTCTELTTSGARTVRHLAL